MNRTLAAASLALGALLWLPPASAGAMDPGPRAVIEQTVEDVLAVLRDATLDAAARRSSIEEIAYQRFDFSTMSRLVLARNWRRFSQAQQQEFEREFKQYLANQYGDRIDRYEQEEVEILGVRDEPRGDVTVRTRIVGGEFEDATVDYRMRAREGEWRVIDVVIEGISLVSNYRDQFKEVLGRSGPEGLLDRLRKKNAPFAAVAP